ncbi:tetraacyldisaccharide 4'-kinase [Acinetobacter sp. MD2(2019)]|uniref:tetraacyldisaccharide 4'-kinase n=1 Tax=Acinetobacter sp. MD2(2019) TaxID=2605273 RepID=UPI002D1F7319|nr:tetraacyldisaccharide 4'-kinase [Acinetobacter sp. MD2(2019)]MEB3752835.1 tetraacyldisaccharide 4'-kinase [Acinetobacter sp. MD2(2019)]
MSLAKSIQNAWNKQSAWLVLLRPLSCVYGCAFALNKALYQAGIKKVYNAPVPVMIIGNITVGGSGKTPLLIQLVQYLRQKNIRVGVISRGYGGKGPFPLFVDADATADLVGDEPCLIVQRTAVPMAVGPNRQQAIELLLQHGQFDLILSDDGLQHWALARQIEWVVLDRTRGLGNEKLLPEGYLREPKTRLQQVTVIEHTSETNATYAMQLQLGQPYLIHSTQSSQSVFDAKQHYHVVVGIGYPERFYRSLTEIGVRNCTQHEFVDHHAYSLDDLKFEDNSPIITTEKDAVKIKALLNADSAQLPNEIWVLPVDAVLSDACYTLLNQQLRQLNICA